MKIRGIFKTDETGKIRLHGVSVNPEEVSDKLDGVPITKDDVEIGRVVKTSMLEDGSVMAEFEIKEEFKHLVV